MKRPTKQGTRSYRNYIEFDCKEKRNRFLQMDSFAGSMGSGELSEPQSRSFVWTYLAPGTIGMTFLNQVCTRNS